MSDSSVAADDALPLLEALIACPSVTPETAGVLDVAAAALAPLGFLVTRLRFEGDGSYPVDNLFATRGTSGPHLLFAGHTDVVPPGDIAGWTHPPFVPTVTDGRIYGRGAADMKSGVAAFIAAAARAIAAGEAQDGRLSLILTNDEEADGINGTEKVMAWAKAQGFRFDFALVGEPSAAARVGDSIKIGRRGSVNGEIVVAGVQGHVAYPQRALNPIPVLARLVTALSGPLDGGNAHFPPTNLEFTSVDVGNATRNVIPAKAVGHFNVRFNTGFTPESLLAELRRRVTAVQAEDEAAKRATIAVDYIKRPSYAFLTEPGPALEKLCAIIVRATGQTPELSTAGGTSDARYVAADCPVIELGLPGPTMHKTDENISLADLEALTSLYRAAIAGFLAG